MKNYFFILSIIYISSATCSTQLEQAEAKKNIEKYPAQIKAIDERLKQLKEDTRNASYKKELEACLSQRRGDLAADLYQAAQIAKTLTSSNPLSLETSLSSRPEQQPINSGIRVEPQISEANASPTPPQTAITSSPVQAHMTNVSTQETLQTAASEPAIINSATNTTNTPAVITQAAPVNVTTPVPTGYAASNQAPAIQAATPTLTNGYVSNDSTSISQIPNSQQNQTTTPTITASPVNQSIQS
jgi:hypothetical protein